jgi:hypothetical protein
MKNRIRAFIVAAAVAASVVPAALPASADNIGNEGCTPGYWKNHTEAWQDYTPGRLLKFPFDFPPELAAYGEMSMLQALSFKGGSDLDGAARILLRAAVAAYLNAAHEGVGYPFRRFMDPGNLESQINAALASLDRDTMLALAAELDEANNLGCPL